MARGWGGAWSIYWVETADACFGLAEAADALLGALCEEVRLGLGTPRRGQSAHKAQTQTDRVVSNYLKNRGHRGATDRSCSRIRWLWVELEAVAGYRKLSACRRTPGGAADTLSRGGGGAGGRMRCRGRPLSWV